MASVLDPFAAKAISPDGRTAFAQVTYDVSAQELTEAQEALAAAAEPARAAGLTVEFGGDALQARGRARALTEVIGIVVAAVVLRHHLRLADRGRAAAADRVIGVGVGVAGHHRSPPGSWTSASDTPILALMLGLGGGIDYALFIVSRYRHELARRPGRPEEAAGRAVGTAGSAVVFAGLTVIIALAGAGRRRHPDPDPDGPGGRGHRRRRGR